ncbi:MAG: hypothetical protein A2041_11935 [Bacteroidetes bacterium GWA2_31_9b]|nr:MAG: hypothetical protein A2041_11935 [Bacteroidetes bacterium GWA2_31_9b]
MKSKAIFFVFLGLIFLLSCNTDNSIICTEEYRMLTVFLSDTSDNPVILTSNYTEKTSTDEIIYFIEEDNYFDSINRVNGIYILFTDGKMSMTTKSGTEFRFKGFIDSVLVVNEPYIIKNDGCHVLLESGNTEIIIE